jgi:hypothetical protein
VNNAKAMSSLNGQTAPLTSSAIVTPAPDNGTAPPEMEVRRAEPVQPMQEQTVLDTTIKPPPLPPLDF